MSSWGCSWSAGLLQPGTESEQNVKKVLYLAQKGPPPNADIFAETKNRELEHAHWYRDTDKVKVFYIRAGAYDSGG